MKKIILPILIFSIMQHSSGSESLLDFFQTDTPTPADSKEQDASRIAPQATAPAAPIAPTPAADDVTTTTTMPAETIPVTEVTITATTITEQSVPSAEPEPEQVIAQEQTQTVAVEEPSEASQATTPVTVEEPSPEESIQPTPTEEPPVVELPVAEPAVIVTETKLPLTVAEQVAPRVPLEKTALSKAAYLGSYLEPWRSGPDELIEFLFENAELSTLLSYVEEKFNITFILDDNIKPLPKSGKSIIGTKISFKTHAPLSKKDAWNIFVTFLDMAGLAAVPGPGERVYRLITSKDPKSPTDASRAPLPTFIGVEPSLIPNNDTLIRYIYTAENTTLTAIVATVDMLRSAASPNAIPIPELNAVIITDRGANIRAMLEIIKELDQPNAQEGIAVVRLERADATKAAKLYADFANKETDQGMAARLFPTRKTSTTEYFPRGAKVIPEPRTNSLIILGTREALETITDFIRKVIDRQDDRPDTPRYIYQLKFLDAENLASVLTESLKFKEDTEAAKSGGVRDGDKYFRPISIVSEPTTNKLIINADYDDYMKIHQLLENIDIEQPQVALRLFLLSIQVTDQVALGTQLRNKIPGPNTLLGDNVNFQTSGLAGVNSGIVERSQGTGATRLLGNLVTLAASATVGSTVFTLGSDFFGVWGILNMLQTYNKVNIVSNPFIVTANKYPAIFKLGEIRRVTDSTIFAQQTQDAFKDLSAVLDINITPQVSTDGLVTLDVYFNLEQFDDANPDSTNGNRSVRKIETSVIVADNEVLALGGLIREDIIEQESRLPVLGSIPIIGYLFKNRAQTKIRTSLLLLIQAEVLHPIKNNLNARLLTEEKVYDVVSIATDLREAHGIQDPINRTFFGDKNPEVEAFVSSFMDKRNVYTVEEVEARAEKSTQPPVTTSASTVCTPRSRRRKAKVVAPITVEPQKATPPTDTQTPSEEISLIDIIDTKRASE